MDRVEEHAHFVRPIASRLKRRSGCQLELDDLEQEGMLGLLDAAKKYDDSLGVPFGAYARLRINGAILDTIRNSFGRTHRIPSCRSLSEPILYDGDEVDLAEILPDPNAVDALNDLLDKEKACRVQTAVGQLRPREQAVIKALYVDEIYQRDIAKSMGCVQSRVSQISTVALGKLRRSLTIQNLPSASPLTI